MGSEKGFTLIELVVVLAIAALLLAIVLPFTFNRRGHDELAGGAREIAGALRLARSSTPRRRSSSTARRAPFASFPTAVRPAAASACRWAPSATTSWWTG
jgi:prepilin-type N-terminal cleavage/methylation domain-containing protein